MTDSQALDAFATLGFLEGILPALEAAHALGWMLSAEREWRDDDLVVLNVSGRGDKDVAHVAELTERGS